MRLLLSEHYPVTMESGDHLPGEPARYAGQYNELNVFGSYTGRSIEAELGERLPVIAGGFAWRYVPWEMPPGKATHDRPPEADR